MQLLRPALGIMLLPAWIGFAIAFFNQLYGIETLGETGVAFAGGGATFFVLYKFGHRLMLTHTLGHELTHALWSMIFKGRVRGISASSTGGGKAHITKTNFLVYLAPYFFPIYTMAVVVLSFFVDLRYKLGVFFLIGLTLAHHILLTLESLRVEQSDLVKSGMLFSLGVIFLGNLAVVTLLASLAFEGVSFWEFLKEGASLTEDAYLVLLFWVFD